MKHFEKLREKGTVVYLKAPLEGLDPGGLRCARRYGSELMMSLSSLDEIYHEEADVVIEPPGVDFTLETLKKMAVFK
jgi:RNase P/RNase MRP subunit POP5